HLTSDVASLIREEKHHRIRDLVSGALSAERNERCIPTRPALTGRPPERRVDEARYDGVDADETSRALPRGVSGEPELARLGCVVRRNPGARPQPGDGRDEYDGGALVEHRQRGLQRE